MRATAAGHYRRRSRRRRPRRRAVALRLYLPSADVTVIRRLYIVTRH